MADHDTSFLSLAAAAVAGALFMYWVEARKHGRSLDGSARPDSVRMQGGGAPHPTRPARAAWNEQGV